jgi:type IV pilus assembly protein PilB
MLGRLLVEGRTVTAEEVDAALDEQRETRERLGQILIRRGVDPEAVARALASQLRLAYAPPPLRPEGDALALVPRPLALRLRLVPLKLSARLLSVAMADPLDASAIDDLQFRTGRRAEPAVATAGAIERAQVEAYGEEAVRRVLRRLMPGREGEEPQGCEDDDVLRSASEAPPIIALVDLMLERAVEAGASDVHVQPHGAGLMVRARVDGVVRSILELPAESSAAVVSRIKIMAGLDIAIKRKPQDGRSAVTVGGRRVDLRVSTLPAADREKVVLRLLDPGDGRPPLGSLGLDAPLLAELELALDREHGLFLVTGPTGSGKTTTLYAVLESRDRAARNIVTLEDPVECRLDGLTQVQVQPRAGLTFASALRAVLRQDPDVIMVGEMRDRETAEVGLAAALTGHLVLSTLHTIDAPGAVSRLVEMGAPRYLVAGGLVGVLAQRLVRRLCPECRSIAPATAQAVHHLGLPIPTHLPRAVGCERCAGTGYRGRIGIFELLRVDAAVRELILQGAPADAIREAAAAAGMVPLPLHAWSRVEAGLTTLDEVRPFLTLLAEAATPCRACGAALGRGHLFCPLCGGAVARRCGCGAGALPHWRFCGGCGSRLSAVERVRDLPE